MSNTHDENELVLLNRLLEQLHQTDYKVLGSIEINIYKPGSQHVDKVERQYITASPPNPGLTPNPSPVGEGNSVREGNLKGRGELKRERGFAGGAQHGGGDGAVGEGARGGVCG